MMGHSQRGSDSEYIVLIQVDEDPTKIAQGDNTSSNQDQMT